VGSQEDDGRLPLLKSTFALPRDFQTVSVLNSPPLVVVQAPDTSKYHGMPSPSSAIKLIVTPRPRKREFLVTARTLFRKSTAVTLRPGRLSQRELTSVGKHHPSGVRANARGFALLQVAQRFNRVVR
jgi:hypothetical protein